MNLTNLERWALQGLIGYLCGYVVAKGMVLMFVLIHLITSNIP